MKAICAACGERTELCGSVRSDGIQQPRICKDCLIEHMQTGIDRVNDVLWMVQLLEANDTQSLEAIKRSTASASQDGNERGEP